MRTTESLLQAAAVALLLCSLLIPAPAHAQVFALIVDVELSEPTIVEVNASIPPEVVTFNGTVEISAKPPNVSVSVTLQTSSTTSWVVTTEPSSMSFSTVGVHPFSVTVVLPLDLNGTTQSGVSITAVAKGGALQSTDQASGSIVVSHPPPPHDDLNVPQRVADAQRGSLVIIMGVLILVVGGGATIFLLRAPLRRGAVDVAGRVRATARRRPQRVSRLRRDPKG